MALTLTVPAGSFHLSGNPLWVKVEGALPPAGSSGYKVLLRILSVDGDLAGAPFTDGKAPEGGVAWFDVSGYVDQPLEKQFEWPLAGGVNPYDHDTRVVSFQPGETWIDQDDNLVETWGDRVGDYFVLKGGVGPLSLGRYNDAGGSFYQGYVLGGRFLTHMPLVQTVHPWQPVKLWLLSAQTADYTLHIKAWYEDGTTAEWVRVHGLYKDILHEVNCLPYHSGWDAMPPVKADGTRMSHYQVWFDALSEVRTFRVDHGYRRNTSFLLAFNSLGGVDVVWLGGEVRSGIETSAVEATRGFPRTGSSRERTVVVASRTGRRTWRINSGWKSMEEMQGLADCLLSKQAWLLADAGGHQQGTLYPVNMAGTGAVLTDSATDLQSVELELIEGHDSQYI